MEVNSASFFIAEIIRRIHQVPSTTLPAIEKEEDFLYLKKFLNQEKDVFRVGVKMSWKEPARGSPNPIFILF